MTARHLHRTEAPARWATHGAALLEALAAFVVLSAAGVAAARLQLPLRLGADAARQGSEAVRVAQRDIEQWRGAASLPTSASAPPGTSGYDALASGTAVSEAASGANTSYRLTRSVITNADPLLAHKTITEQVDWLDRAGHPQRIVIDTVVARSDPALSGALWLARSAPPLLPRNGRPPTLPAAVRRLGDGTSLVDLGEDGMLLRVNDRDGAILATCSREAASSGDAGLAALAACVSVHGLLLSGHVRFDDSAAGRPWSFGVQAIVTDGSDPASPPVCATRADTAGSGATYRCAIYLAADHVAWSGRTVLVPIGWTVGVHADQRKVCRYSRDDDGSGAIDRNAEHPANYVGVAEPLTQQNFLVVRGDLACPAHPPMHPGETGVATVQHQP